MDVWIDEPGSIGHILESYLKLTSEGDVAAKLKPCAQMQTYIATVESIDKCSLRMKIIGFGLHYAWNELTEIIDRRIIYGLLLLASKTVGVIEAGIYVPS